MVKVFSRQFLGCSFVTTLAYLGLGFLPLSAQAIIIREATIREVKCVSPSSGINTVSRAVAAAIGGAVGGATATVATGATGGLLIGTYGLAIAGGASTGVTVINGLDQFFSGEDDLYVRVNGNRAWPSGDPVEIESQQTIGVNYTTPLTAPLTIELMDYDSISGDDSLGALTLQPDQLNSPGGRRWIVRGADGSVYEMEVEIGIADDTGSQLASNGTSTIATATKDRNGIYQVGTYLRSDNGRYRVTMQSDGNLVMYDNQSNAPIWSSGTNGRGEGPFKATVQSDGNFVIYNSNNQAQWSTRTNGRGVGPYRLILQDDRNLVLYDANNTALWASNTNI